MTRKPNRKAKRYSRPRSLKSVRRDKRHPEFGLKESAMRLTLEASQIVRLAQLARQNGTTLSVELDNAIDAYALGMSQGEIRMLHALLDRLNVATAKTNKALDAALRETEKARAHSTRKKRSGRR